MKKNSECFIHKGIDRVLVRCFLCEPHSREVDKSASSTTARAHAHLDRDKQQRFFCAFDFANEYIALCSLQFNHQNLRLSFSVFPFRRVEQQYRFRVQGLIEIGCSNFDGGAAWTTTGVCIIIIFCPYFIYLFLLVFFVVLFHSLDYSLQQIFSHFDHEKFSFLLVRLRVQVTISLAAAVKQNLCAWRLYAFINSTLCYGVW